MTARARTRFCAVLLHHSWLALIRRERPDGVQHSLPGGLIEEGEDPHAALRREPDDPGRAPVERIPLADAAGLHLYSAVGPVLHRAAGPATGPVLPGTDDQHLLPVALIAAGLKDILGPVAATPAATAER